MRVKRCKAVHKLNDCMGMKRSTKLGSHTYICYTGVRFIHFGLNRNGVFLINNGKNKDYLACDCAIRCYVLLRQKSLWRENDECAAM